MSDIQFTIDPTPARQSKEDIVRSLSEILHAAEFTGKRSSDSIHSAAAKIAKNLGVDIQQATAKASGSFEQYTKSTHMAGSAGAGLVDSQNQLSAAVRRTARSVAILQGPLGPVAGRITMLGVAVGDVGIALTALGLTLTGTIAVLLKASRAGAEFESQLAQTNAVLRATGGTANQTAESIENLSRNIGRYTLASTQEVRKAATQMLTFRKVSEDAFGRAMHLAQDLAAVGFGSLEGAARQLARALEDPSVGLTALRRAGVSFTMQQRDMIVEMFKAGEVAKAQGLILDEVAKQVGGAGIAAAVGMKAAFDTLGEEFKLLFESMGTGELYRSLGSIVNTISNSIRTLQENMDVLIGSAKALTQALLVLAAVKVALMFKGMAFAIVGVATAMATYIMRAVALLYITESVSVALNQGAASAGRFQKALAFIAGHKVLVALAALTAGFYIYNRTISDQKDISREASNAADDLGSAIGRTMDMIFGRSGGIREGTLFTDALVQIRALNGEIEDSAILYRQLSAARASALNDRLPDVSNQQMDMFGDSSSGAFGRVASRIADIGTRRQLRKLEQELADGEKEIQQGLERLAAGIISSTEDLSSILGAVGSEAASSLAEGLSKGLSDFDEAGLDKGIDNLVHTFNEASRSLDDILKPSINIEEIVSDLNKLTEAVGPQLDRQTRGIVALSRGIETSQESLDRYFEAIKGNSSVLSFYEQQIKDIERKLSEGNLSLTDRRILTAELREVTEKMNRTQRLLNELTGDYDTLNLNVVKATEARTAASEKLVDELRQEVFLEEQKLAAMAVSSDALARVEMLQRKQAESTRLSNIFLEIHGENWREVNGLLDIYNRHMANIERRQALTPSRGGKQNDGQNIIDRLREQIREQEYLVQGIKRASYEREVEKALLEASRISNQQVASTIRELAEEYRSLASEVERRNQLEKNTQDSNKIRAQYDAEFKAVQDRLDLEKEIDRLTNQPGGFSETEATTLKWVAANKDLYESLMSIRNELYPTVAATDEYLNKVQVLDDAWAAGLLTGELYWEMMNKLAEGDPEAGMSFWEKWLQGAEDAFVSFEDIAGSTIENFSKNFGKAFEEVIFDAQDLRSAIHGLAESMARSIVRALGEMAAQWLIYKLVQQQAGRAAQMSAATTIAANASAMSLSAGVNAFASTAAIPIVGPFMAPAAMASALAATAPLAAAAASAAFAGVAHGGIDNVPREGTWLLDRDERVLQPQANKDLTEFLKRQEEMQNNQAPQGEIRIVNVVDKDLVQDFMTGAEGDRVIVNSLRRNAGAIRQLLM